MNKILCLSLLLFLLGCNSNRPTGIGLPLVMKDISKALHNNYGLKTSILKSKPIPKQAFVNIKSPRYRADIILKILKEEKPDTLDYIIAMTNKDISTTKRDSDGNTRKPESKYKDWGIFGLGYRPGPSCIISSFRLNNTSQKNYRERIKKVAIHEIGHNIGLKHCPTSKCVMQDAVETIRTVDAAGIELCAKCKKEIGLN